MQNPQSQTKTSALPPVIFMVLLVAAIIGSSWYLWTHQGLSPVKMPAAVSPKGNATVLPSNGQAIAIYQSKLGGFSFAYPAAWSIRGFHDVTPVDAAHLDGNETQISLVSGEGIAEVFGMNLRITDTPPAANPVDDYANGVAVKGANGVTIWQEHQQVTTASGPTTVTCPQLRIGGDGTYSVRLANGKYLSLYQGGSYCPFQGTTTAMTYEEQVNSTAWSQARVVLGTIDFHNSY